MSKFICSTSAGRFDGKCLCSAYNGWGILFGDVPATGEHGASVFANDGVSPADDAVALRWEVATPPATGTLVIAEDGSFSWTGLTDGTHSFTANIYTDGTLHANSPVTISVTIGVADTALAGTATLAITGAGALTTQIPLTGSAALGLTASGNLSSAIRLQGAASMSLVGAADLSTAIGLQATAALGLGAAADLSTQIRLQGAAALALTAAGALADTPSGAIQGSASLGLSATGSLTTQIRLAGSAPLGLAAAADLATQVRLAGAAALALTATGNLTTAIALAGSATLRLSASGRLVGVGLGPIEDLALVSITAQRAPISITPARETRAI